MSRKSIAVHRLLAASALLSFGGAASAQEAGLGNSDEIIVTARKREETSIAVPVAITAVGSAELQRRAINTMDSLARIVPGLTISENPGSGQGGTIALRGVAGPDTNPFGDQAVSFNIDGVQVAKSSVRRLAFMDLQQIEVLKGPQALFFGKNSPGGIISIRSADPTRSFEAKASSGYEFNAHEWRGEGYISGPLTDTLGARLAVYGSDMRGWIGSEVPRENAFAPQRRFGPKSREYALRGTLKFDPSERFSARLKVAYAHRTGDSLGATMQTINCPYGSSQLPGVVDDCTANSTNNRGDLGTTFTPYEPKMKNGVPYGKHEQVLAGLEMSYKISDHLDLTSVTGYYKAQSLGTDHYNRYPADPILQFGFLFGPGLIANYYTYNNKEISQELRLGSSFDGPINFTVGGIYSDSRSNTSTHAFLNPPDPIELFEYYLAQHGKAYSVFGQLRWNPVSELELSAGGRYSHENKKLPTTLLDQAGSRTGPMTPYTPIISNVSFNDFSPELTATYRPTDRLTFFASYKRGFLSGGFNSSAPIFTLPINYGPQKIRGFEGGVKAALLGGALRTNLSLFNYKVLGLQITAYENDGTIGTIRNAGEVSIKGAEFDMSYATPINGLFLNAAVSYNRGRYRRYDAPCYYGQTQALGCNLGMVNGVGTLQSLVGTQLSNAPEWSGNVGARYERNIDPELKLGLSTDLNFSDGYPNDAFSAPQLRSPRRALLDATVRVGDANDAWEVAVIGRNLTNKYYWNAAQQSLFTGGPAGGTGASLLSDGIGVVNRGRELMLRLSVKFGG